MGHFIKSYQKYITLFLSKKWFHTLSGRIGKVVASHAAVARSIPLRCTDLYYARGAQGVLPCVGWGVRPVNWIYRL